MKNSGVASRRKLFLKIGIFILLLTWLGFLLARKIDLTSADLGRHLQNGKWVVENHFNIFEKNSPLFQNYYSYTNPDFPVVNHHWGSGVFFYFIFKLFGFSGLSLLYILLSLVAFLLFFLIAVEESSFTLAVILSFFLAPLMAERVEIRPEVFSVLFSAIFFFALWQYTCHRLSARWLIALIPLQIIWVNFHVYFFLGIFLAGAYLLEALLRKLWGQVKILSILLLALVLGSLVNPFGLTGLIYPLQIFQNYGYTIVENKSVSFVENYGIQNPNFLVIKAVLVLLVFSWVIAIAARRKNLSVSLFLASLFFGIIAWLAIRNFTLLGFLALPILAVNFGELWRRDNSKMIEAKENLIACLYIVLVALALYDNYQYVSAHLKTRGIGLEPGVEKAAIFLRQENIAGPIFNNYDVGGYLIWNLCPKEKVFVDNRPEAYPVSFFDEVYKPMQDYENIWNEQKNKWNFNAVVFYYHDITPWSQSFAGHIQKNPEWAKVFQDDYIEIFLRRNEPNQRIIKKYETQSSNNSLLNISY